MTFDEIERVLGLDVVNRVRSAVEGAYLTSRQVADPRAGEALEDLLIALLVATTISPSDVAAGQSRMSDCGRRMERLTEVTVDLFTSQACSSRATN